MTTDRIKEIQNTTGYPDSVPVQQALLQVWNEVAQESNQVQAGVSLNFAETKKEYDRFFYLYQYTYASSPDILLVGNTTERLWKWFEQKLKDVSKISD